MQNSLNETILSPNIIRIGGGVVNETGEILSQLGLSKPLIVTDKNLCDLGHVDHLTNILAEGHINCSIFNETIPEPTDICLSSALHLFKSKNFDCVIGFGGGSCLDVAKAVSAMAVSPGHVRDYKQPAQINRSGVPIILIPTTGGTGSELTKWCVISDTILNEKYNLSGLGLLATASIIDWKFTITKPPRITADTAIDSLTHAIEAYISKRSSHLSDNLALKALPLIAKNICAAYKNPVDYLAREALMLGSSLAGMAFSNSSVALVHGMSRPIGAYFHIAHGLSNAMLLTEVTKFSIDFSTDRYANCAVAAGWANSTDSKSVACEKLVRNLTMLTSNLEIPSPSSQGINKRRYFESLPSMARQALESGSPENNPRVPSSDEIIEIYKLIW